MTPMQASESLSMESKREYLAKMLWRYGQARGRQYKSRLIEELMAVCGYSRKHAIKVLKRRGRPRVLKKAGPKPTYAAGGDCCGAERASGLEAISSVANDSRRHCRSGCRIMKKNAGGSGRSRRKSSGRSSAATIDRLPARLRNWCCLWWRRCAQDRS